MSSRHASYFYLLLAVACGALILTRSPATTIVDAHVSSEMRPEPGGHEAHTRPSDYFYAQRARADGSFPQEQFDAALQQLAVERAHGPSVSAGVPWTPVGPYNIDGRVTALAVAPGGTTLYLGAAHGHPHRHPGPGARLPERRHGDRPGDRGRVPGAQHRPRPRRHAAFPGADRRAGRAGPPVQGGGSRVRRGLNEPLGRGTAETGRNTRGRVTRTGQNET